MTSVMWDGPELAMLYDRISDLQFEGGRRLVAMMGVGPGEAVLDVGCGTGRLAVYLADVVGPSGRVTGIDPSPHRIQIAREKLNPARRRNLQFTIGRGEDLSAFGGSGFDHACYSSVIHWIGEKRAALAEAYRVLKPGGSLAMNTVDKAHHFAMKKVMDDLIARKYSQYADLGDEMMRQLVDGAELAELLGAAGFRDVRVEVVPEKHCYASPKELFDFIEASSFGNFLRGVPGHVRSEILEDMGKGLERMRTPAGIELASNMLYAMASKP